jgi:uncharacterized membrane protein YqjE
VERIANVQRPFLGSVEHNKSKKANMETIARAFAALFVMVLGIGVVSLAMFLLIAVLSTNEDIQLSWGLVAFMCLLSASGVFLIFLGVNHFRHERWEW